MGGVARTHARSHSISGAGVKGRHGFIKGVIQHCQVRVCAWAAATQTCMACRGLRGRRGHWGGEGWGGRAGGAPAAQHAQRGCDAPAGAQRIGGAPQAALLRRREG